MATLRPRARIIRTIGDQLISGPDAALIELVKNAFDADSPSVKIKIIPRSQKHPRGLVTVKDFGHGMTYTDIIERLIYNRTRVMVKRTLWSANDLIQLGLLGDTLCVVFALIFPALSINAADGNGIPYEKLYGHGQ